MFVRSVVFLAASATCIILTGFNAWCQSSTLNTSDPRGYILALAKKYKIPYSSRHYKMLSSESPGKEKEISYSSGTVIRHVKGKHGTSFPSLEGSEPATVTFKDKDLKLLAEKAVEIGKSYADSFLRTKVIGPCLENNSERTLIEFSSEELQNTVFVDTLFIAKSDIPKNPKEVFGKNVFIQPYTVDKKNPVFYSVVGYGIKCLPTRIRITGKYSIRETGRPALRNYDEDPNGKGFMHKDAPRI